MPQFVVTVETSRDNDGVGLANSELQRFAQALAPHRGSVSASTSGWAARLTVIANDETLAVGAAFRRLLGAARLIGIEQRSIVLNRVELAPDAAEGAATIPEIVGVGEVQAMLGISKQRLHQLRSAGRFPIPDVELMSGPIWLRTSIDTWAATNWNRKVGRPSYRRIVDSSGQFRDLGLARIGDRQFVVIAQRDIADSPSLSWVAEQEYLTTEGFEQQQAIVYVPVEHWDERTRRPRRIRRT